MGLKHLFGFGLIIIGMGLAPLFFSFLSDSESFDTAFLYSLGVCALAFFFLGLFILNRSR